MKQTACNNRHNNFVSLVLDLPAAPTNLTLVARTDTSLSVSWNEVEYSEPTGRILGYFLWYSASPTNENASIIMEYINITDTSQTVAEIVSLKPFQEYGLGVATYTEYGVGSFSETFRITTSEGVPSESPTDVAVMIQADGSVRVTWLPPNPESINGIAVGYKIVYWEVGMDGAENPDTRSEVQISVDPVNPFGIQEGLIQNLTRRAMYQVAVLMFTVKGDGPLSDWIQISLEESGIIGSNAG